MLGGSVYAAGYLEQRHPLEFQMVWKKNPPGRAPRFVLLPRRVWKKASNVQILLADRNLWWQLMIWRGKKWNKWWNWGSLKEHWRNPSKSSSLKAKDSLETTWCSVYGQDKTLQNRWENATFTNLRLCWTQQGSRVQCCRTLEPEWSLPVWRNKPLFFQLHATLQSHLHKWGHRVLKSFHM